MATFRNSTPVIVAVQSTNHENERRPSLEAQQAVGRSKAERNRIRGKDLAKVFERAPRSG
jgi:hypothetical protein